MPKWEYYTLSIQRMPEWVNEKDDFLRGCQWYTFVNGKAQDLFLDKTLNELGEAGWELISAVTESDLCGGPSSIGGKIRTQPAIVGNFGLVSGDITGESKDFAGFTTQILFFFKRLKE